MPVNYTNVERIEIAVSTDNSLAGGEGTGNGYVYIYEVQAINSKTNYFNPVQLSDISTAFEAKEYDDKNNISDYNETRIEHLWHAYSNGIQVDEGELVVVTNWENAVYDVDRPVAFTQTVNKTAPDGSLDITEITTRTNTWYEKENPVGYDETYIPNIDEDLIFKRHVSDMAYAGGKVEGYTEVSDKFRENTGSTPVYMTTTTTARHGMEYDDWGNLVGWQDDIMTPTNVGDVNNVLRNVWNNAPENSDLRKWFPNVDKDNYNGEGEWDEKTLLDWALETGYQEYEELYMYAPFELTSVRSDSTYDENGRAVSYTDYESGYKDLVAGKPREWEGIETKRIFTFYNAADQITCYQDDITHYEHDEHGNPVIKKGPEPIKESSITYDKYGHKYSYNKTVEGQTSRVDSSTYNSLSQLVETYTKIDANSYSKTYYFYDQAGNISQTKYYYYYHQETEQSDRNGRYNVIQHCEKTIWYDKYGDKTSENTNQYTDVQVISQSFWATFFGRAIISVISAILNAIPGPGPFLSMAFNTAISIIQGTFDWVSLASQIVTFGLRQYGADLLKSIPGLEGMQKFFGDVLGIGRDAASTGWDMFLPNAVLGSTQALVGEGIYEVGRENEWDPFLTSAVASFSSTAVGFAYGSATGRVKFTNMMDIGKYFAIEAAKSLAMASIDKFVEENPSDWARFMAPIAKMAINQISSLPKEDKAMP
ncbi:MAG: hypothetical protein WBC16_06845, partial [Candidatus Omnitrophota bacterium]